MLNTILELLKQRRVWAGFVGMLAFILQILNLDLGIEVPILTDLLSAFGGALAALIAAGLALWSYIKPKMQKK